MKRWLEKLTIVRLPLSAPHVLRYAVDMAPKNAPKTAHSALSVNPRLKTSGPSKPTARLLIEMFALNHSSIIWIYPVVEGACLSSGGTRAMPRASKPARFSMRVFHRLKRLGTGRVVEGERVDETSAVMFFSRSAFSGDVEVESTLDFIVRVVHSFISNNRGQEGGWLSPGYDHGRRGKL